MVKVSKIKLMRAVIAYLEKAKESLEIGDYKETHVNLERATEWGRTLARLYG